MLRIKQLIKELQSYPSNTLVTFKLIKDKDDESQDEIINWVGEIDTSLVHSDESYLDIGLEMEVSNV